VLAAAASDVSEAANSQTAVTDCQIAVDSLCLDNNDGTSIIRSINVDMEIVSVCIYCVKLHLCLSAMCVLIYDYMHGT